jgi:DNA-binding transcriptional MocR family regulator
MAADTDTTRTKVETYLPAYQKERWREHAEELEMSQSEFVKAMVQAGRRGFEAEAAGEREEGNASSEKSVEPETPDSNPGGNDLEDRVLAVLDEGSCSWEELVDRMTDDIEERLDAVLEDLQRANRIRYSGRNGGYTRTETEAE